MNCFDHTSTGARRPAALLPLGWAASIYPARGLRRFGLRTAKHAGTDALYQEPISAWPLFGGTELWSVVSYCSAQHQAIGLKFPCLSVEPPRGDHGGYALIETP